MPSNNLTDLMALVPGDYVVHRQAYAQHQGFQDDLSRAEQFCQANGLFFEAIPEPDSKRLEAFFVHVRRH